MFAACRGGLAPFEWARFMLLVGLGVLVELLHLEGVVVNLT